MRNIVCNQREALYVIKRSLYVIKPKEDRHTLLCSDYMRKAMPCNYIHAVDVITC